MTETWTESCSEVCGIARPANCPSDAEVCDVELGQTELGQSASSGGEDSGGDTGQPGGAQHATGADQERPAGGATPPSSGGAEDPVQKPCGGGCPADQRCDETRATCVDCVSDADCAGRDGTPACAAGACVSCVDNAGCREPTVCDASNHVCVGCRGDSDCEESLRCSDAQTCVSCLVNEDCAAGLLCSMDATGLPDVASNTCVQCLSSEQCEGADEGAVCSGGRCVQCVTSTDCDSPLVCDTGSNRCVTCLADEDCGDPGMVCDEPSRSCVRCTENGECPEAAPVCMRPEEITEESPAPQCVECLMTADCNPDAAEPAAGPRHCRALDHACVACTENSHCSGTSAPLCYQDPLAPTAPTSNRCVQCLSNADCKTADNPRCDLFTHQCKPCQSNFDCEGIATGGVCDNNGADPLRTGRCVQCTGANYGSCGTVETEKGPAQRVCNSLARTCSAETVDAAYACDPCVSDAHCMPDSLCVARNDEEQEGGFICFPKRTESSCDALRPFASTYEGTSIDGAKDAVCELAAPITCGARYALGTSCSDDDDCGLPEKDDGFCVKASGSQSGLCSYPCATENDCPPRFGCRFVSGREMCVAL